MRGFFVKTEMAMILLRSLILSKNHGITRCTIDYTLLSPDGEDKVAVNNLEVPISVAELLHHLVEVGTNTLERGVNPIKFQEESEELSRQEEHDPVHPTPLLVQEDALSSEEEVYEEDTEVDESPKKEKVVDPQEIKQRVAQEDLKRKVRDAALILQRAKVPQQPKKTDSDGIPSL